MNRVMYSTVTGSSTVRRWLWHSTRARFTSTRASAVRPANANETWSSSLSILRTVLHKTSPDCNRKNWTISIQSNSELQSSWCFLSRTLHLVGEGFHYLYNQNSNHTKIQFEAVGLEALTTIWRWKTTGLSLVTWFGNFFLGDRLRGIFLLLWKTKRGAKEKGRGEGGGQKLTLHLGAWLWISSQHLELWYQCLALPRLRSLSSLPPVHTQLGTDARRVRKP